MDVKKVSILEKIGQGSFASVYRCLFNNQFCALKIIKLKEDGCKEWNSECIKREFILLNRLNHPNIVNMLYFYQIQSQCEFRFVLELMKNGSLRDLLHRFKINLWKFAERELLCFTQDIAFGLKYLHQNGVIHRDLKPENLLCDSNFRLKITDFGVSKLSVDNQSANHTRVGTLAYMAPEVYLSHEYDNSVDVWAFGVIFAEMVLTEYPLTKEEKSKIMNFSVKYKPLQIDMVRKNYSRDAQLIIDASLQRDPRLRWCIADICRLPIFSNAPQKISSQVHEVAAPVAPPKPTAPKNSINQNKENKCLADVKKHREGSYYQFIEPLVKQKIGKDKKQMAYSKRPPNAFGILKVRNENVPQQSKPQVSLFSDWKVDRKKSPMKREPLQMAVGKLKAPSKIIREQSAVKFA